MQPVIKVGNSFSLISNLEPVAFAALRTHLSYTKEASTYYSHFPPRPTYLLDKNGNFPTGLVSRVQKYLTNTGLPYRIDDMPFKRSNTLPVEPDMLLGVTLRVDQQNAVKASLGVNRGTISMPTGTGKGLVITALIKAANTSTLVVVPNIELKLQLSTTIKKFLPGRKNIIVEHIASSGLEKHKNFNMLIIDECHHVAASTYQALNRRAWTEIPTRYFFTATPFRNQKDESLLYEGLAGQTIYTLSYKRAVQIGAIVPVEAYYLEIPKTPNDYFTWSEVYSNLVVNNKVRNKAIATLLSRLSELDAATLCLVKEVAHGEALHELTGIPFSHGDDAYSRTFISKFAEGETTGLIGTTGLLGEGIDTKPCEFVIIAGLGKAKSAFMQQVGRAVRTYKGKESAKIVIIKDLSHKFTRSHFNTQKKILLTEYGVAVFKLDL